jgi:uncharacterized protein (TIGR00725 family)
MTETTRRRVVAVIGDSKLEPNDQKISIARECGRLLVDSGCRVMTGGMSGVMDAAMQGARASASYREGDTIGVLPSHDPLDAASSADIVLATGLSLARNIIVANADGVIAIGGGAGTLSEIALAWQLRRPVVAIEAEGWSSRLGGVRIDYRKRTVNDEDNLVHAAKGPRDAVALLLQLLPRHTKRLRFV